jgi:hypothetical protein
MAVSFELFRLGCQHDQKADRVIDEALTKEEETAPLEPTPAAAPEPAAAPASKKKGGKKK